MSLRVGADTGGTFTDLVLVDEGTGERRMAKVPSTPDDPARAVFAALEQAGCEAAEIAIFVLGTTIATNCLVLRAEGPTHAVHDNGRLRGRAGHRRH